MSDFFVFLAISSFSIYLLFRLSYLSSKVRENQIKEQIIREAVKQQIQKKKLDELYGREQHD